jgi:hypothetical protein
LSIDIARWGGREGNMEVKVENKMAQGKKVNKVKVENKIAKKRKVNVSSPKRLIMVQCWLKHG